MRYLILIIVLHLIFCRTEAIPVTHAQEFIEILSFGKQKWMQMYNSIYWCHFDMSIVFYFIEKYIWGPYVPLFWSFYCAWDIILSTWQHYVQIPTSHIIIISYLNTGKSGWHKLFSHFHVFLWFLFIFPNISILEFSCVKTIS